MKTALITGANGQDASYLAELLIEKGYIVHGTIRRNSVPESQTTRIEKIHNDGLIHLHYADLTDPISIETVIQRTQPDEIYHLAAQSHVQISFDLPKYTLDTNCGGTLAVLEAVRRFSPHSKVYFAATSEMFGNNIDSDGFQRESTLMNPVSPYGCSKLYGYNLCHNYRNSYDMFITNGILFNHECVSENTIIITKNKNTNIISIDRIKDLVSLRHKGKTIQQFGFSDTLIWDGSDWVTLNLATATKMTSKKNDDNFKIRITNTRNGVIETTNHHNLLNKTDEKVRCVTTDIGDELKHGYFPAPEFECAITEDESLFLGLIAGDGYVQKEGSTIRLINNNPEILELGKNLWQKITLGTTSNPYTHSSKESYGTSTSINFTGNSDFTKRLRNELYSSDGYKKVPARVLNSPKNIQLKFLEGYNMCDGLKQSRLNYEFQNFKTNSNLLAQGLLYLISNTTGQSFNITFEYNEKHFGYYSINLLSPKEITNHVLKKSSDEIKKTLYHTITPEWVFDIETSSGKFMANVGRTVIANSPRRGINFVTNKIALGAVKIFYGLEKQLVLGNLDAQRDWGHARDYVKAMYTMLQEDKPNDYVISTGETRSVREFVEIVFDKLDMSWQDYVVTDQKYMRPEELHYLKGDCSKAKTQLGWKPDTSFDEMVDEMVEHWLKFYK